LEISAAASTSLYKGLSKGDEAHFKGSQAEALDYKNIKVLEKNTPIPRLLHSNFASVTS